MGEMAQIALTNFLVFAIAVILIIYILYLFTKKAVEKSDGNISLEAKNWNKGALLRKFIFTFLYSAITAFLIYLVGSDKISAIICFAVFFILRSLTPERIRKPKSSKSKAFSMVFLFLLVFLTAIWTASINIKVGAWLILFIIYLLEKIEKKYFILDSTSSHDL